MGRYRYNKHPISCPELPKIRGHSVGIGGTWDRRSPDGRKAMSRYAGEVNNYRGGNLLGECTHTPWK